MMKITAISEKIPVGKICLSLVIAMTFILLSFYDYLLFHVAVEFASIVISISIFMLAWNARKFMSNNYLLLFGIASLFIGIIDFFHTMSYRGMPLFDDFGANLATQLWIAARFMQGITLLIAPFFLNRRLRPRLTLAIYAVITIVIFDLVLAGFFPKCFIEGEGLTTFKIVCEYIISIILVGAIYFLYKKRNEFYSHVYSLLIAAIILMIFSELSFTLYVSTHGFPNLVGHIFKAAEFFLIYMAVFQTGLTKPYRFIFKKLHDSNRLKDIFIDIMGHDMLNPAGAVKIRSQIALSKEKDPERKEHLRFIYRESEKLIHMIEGAKKLSKLEGTQTLEKEEKDIKKIIQGAIKSLDEERSKKNQKIILKGKGNFIARVNNLIYDVYENLLSNAIKYSPENSTIYITIEQNASVEVAVYDTGKGIPDKHKKAIFKRFSRIEKAQIKGTGLGLAIVKKVVQAHNGSVWIEDNPKGGSIFRVRIPR